MDHDDDRLLKIGVFSTLSRLSVRMLRHYQDCGVLEPAVVDPFTGHRSYRPEQLTDAHLIAALRDAGFGIADMTELIKAIGDPARVDEAIERHRRRLRAAADHAYVQLAALDHIGSTLKEKLMPDVTTTTLPEMIVASLRRTVPTYADESELWKEIMPLLTQSGASFPAGGIFGATFHDPEHHESDTDIEVWIQIATPLQPGAPVECRAEPSRKIVYVRMTGDYAQIPTITTALGTYIAEHHLDTGPMFIIYRVTPTQNPDPTAWVTDICFPIIPA